MNNKNKCRILIYKRFTVEIEQKMEDFIIVIIMIIITGLPEESVSVRGTEWPLCVVLDRICPCESTYRFLGNKKKKKERKKERKKED